MKTLAESLYFKNLDNNIGVFHHRIDAAEEEFKEAVLAYYFLLTENRDLTRGQLDAAVESWFESKHTCQINLFQPYPNRHDTSRGTIQKRKQGRREPC